MENKSFLEKIEALKMPVRLGILVGTVVLLAAAFAYAVYFPSTKKIAATTSSIKDLNGKLNRAKIQRKKLPKVRKEKEDVDIQFAAALKLLPNDKEIPELLTKISELGTEANLVLSKFNFQKERKKGFYAEIPISLKIRGSYHDVAIFFEKIGKMERIMNIQNVQMKPIAERSTILDVTCDAITYTFIKGN